MDPLVLVYDGPLTPLPELGFKKDGYNFYKWYLDSDCTSETSFKNKDLVRNLTDKGTITLYAKWSTNTYDIHFEKNGIPDEISGFMADQTMIYDNPPESLSKCMFFWTGYTFAGWNTREDGKGIHYDNEQAVNNLTTTTEVTLYAQWTPNQYNLGFDTDGGEPMDPVKVTYRAPYGDAIKIPVKTGYTFDYWYYMDGSTEVRVTGSTIVTIPDDHVLSASFNVNQYEVVFNGNNATDGSMSNMCLFYDTDGTLPDCAYKRTGYQFHSWNTSADGKGVMYASGDTVRNLIDKGTFTLYAIWIANEYTISFDSTGGSDVDSMQVTYGTDYGDLPVPSMTGYTFDGWFTAEEGGQRVWSTSSVSITENQKLYAVWYLNTYTVLFDGNGATYGTSFSQMFVYNVPQELNKNTFEKDGYTFREWNTRPDGSGESYADRAEVVNLAAKDIAVLYAQWDPVLSTVHFDTDGGSHVDDLTIAYGKPYGDLPEPVKDGFLFSGWYTQNGVRITSDTMVYTTEDHTLYAHWVLSFIPVEKIQLNKDMIIMYIGQPDVYLIAVITPDDATDVGVTWSSSDDAVVSVDEHGVLTAHGYGTAVITVTTDDGGFTAECTVLVNRIVETVAGGELTPKQVNDMMEQLETFDLHNVTPVVSLRSDDSESIKVPAEIMNEVIRQHGKINMTVSNGSSVYFTAESLSGIDFAHGTSAVFTIERIHDASGPDSQMIANGTVYEITLKLDGVPITSFREVFTLALHYEPEEGGDSDSIRLFHLGIHGTEVVKQYWYDSQEHYVTVNTGHLSRYAIVAIPSEESSFSLAVIATVFLIALILTAEVTTILWRRNRTKAKAAKSEMVTEEFIAENWHGGPPENWIAKPEEIEKKPHRR